MLLLEIKLPAIAVVAFLHADDRLPEVGELKEKTIRDWILRGELPAYTLGKEWRIRRDHFDEAMEARLVTGEPARTGGLWDPDDAT